MIFCKIRMLLLGVFLFLTVLTKLAAQSSIQKAFFHPGEQAKPWVFWYWLHGAVSKAGIQADLKAMKDVGIGGAYLMPIYDSSSKIDFQPQVRQLTPEWWKMVEYAFQEAKKNNLRLGFHVSDGFALAGGPWIQPYQSMKKLVWTERFVSSNQVKPLVLPQPSSYKNYYQDIKVLAFPTSELPDTSRPSVYSSAAEQPFFLLDTGNHKQTFRAEQTAWIEYRYANPFTLRSIKVRTGGTNYASHRLWVLASKDGVNFDTVTRLQAPRHGWQDADEEVTHAVPATSALVFRFVYDKSGLEPGSEELDAAKWKPTLKIVGLYPSNLSRLNQIESKNGAVWRISSPTNSLQYPDQFVVPAAKVLDISSHLKADGTLDWKPALGNWQVVRIGYTSTGHTNYTGGAALGLECDKLDPKAVNWQFQNWFEQLYKNLDPSLVKSVLSVMHIDSWECGSQNWTASFPELFYQKRGYELGPYLLSLTGVAVESVEKSEQVLYDFRKTVTELVDSAFFGTLRKKADELGLQISAEAIAPTMLSDGLLHYKKADIPMGEFWWKSPTHDKPNDLLDAVSGGHIYGKNIIQAEAFTTLRMDWSEHPALLKSLGDRNLATGINRLSFHVFMHNPWMDKKPGIAFNGVGLYFQRDQTWFQQSKAWMEYLTRCQSLLQYGKPVVDLAVYTGDEYPNRSLLPNKLVRFLPGLIGEERIAAERTRLLNENQPMKTEPEGVSHTANSLRAGDWINPLNGYQYDCLNNDVLLKAFVQKGKIVLPGGASYALLAIPYQHSLLPDAGHVSREIVLKIKSLLKAGGQILMEPGDWKIRNTSAEHSRELFQSLHKFKNFHYGIWEQNDLNSLGIPKQVALTGNPGILAWTHRSTEEGELYFISNQSGKHWSDTLEFSHSGTTAVVLNPMNGEVHSLPMTAQKGKKKVQLNLDPDAAVFVFFPRPTLSFKTSVEPPDLKQLPLQLTWDIAFNDGKFIRKIHSDSLFDWSQHSDPQIKYYSGTATYSSSFNWSGSQTHANVQLNLGRVEQLATVFINNREVGTAWAPPYQLNVGPFLKPGINTILIKTTNTWFNRLLGDSFLNKDERQTFTNAPLKLEGKSLQSAGLLGPVFLLFTF